MTKITTAQLNLEQQYQEIRSRIAEIAQYASELDSPADIMHMLQWMENEHKDLIARLYSALHYGQDMRRLYEDVHNNYSNLTAALALADLDHPMVEKLWDEAADNGQKNAIVGLMMRISIGQAISPADAGAILNALERPDNILPAYRGRIADKLRALADKLDQPEKQAS